MRSLPAGLAPTLAAAVLLILPASGCAQQERKGEGMMGSITDIAGIEVGHHTLTERPTGCTVILARDGAVGGVDVRGGGPGTREIALLDPVNSVQEVHGIVLSGGSAYGLETAGGVMRYLEEQGIGFETGVARVPIVPAAILYDLPVGGKPGVRPGADCGYAAASGAAAGLVAEGSVGAGAGATVGKLRGFGLAMKGGIGTASEALPRGLVVGAIVAVNAIGDIIDPSSGEVVAGVRTADGRSLADARRLLRESTVLESSFGENTTIGVVATNATLTKAQATKLAQMAHDGLARAIYPAHTPWDGDTIFALATGEVEGEADLIVLGGVAADVVAEAILDAVRTATGLEGLPSVSEFSGSR